MKFNIVLPMIFHQNFWK